MAERGGRMPLDTRNFLSLVDRKTGEPVGARRSLAGVHNNWLYEREREKARHTAGSGTDEECEVLLVELERACKNRFAMWRSFQ
jgi:hypothetical protein